MITNRFICFLTHLIKKIFLILIIVFFNVLQTFGQTTTNTILYPTGASNGFMATGYVVPNGTKFNGDLIVSSNSGRGWAKLDISSIPSNAIINSAVLKFYVDGGVASTASNYIVGFSGDPQALNGTALYPNINSSSIILNTSAWSMGSFSTPSLNVKVLNASSYIQSQLQTGYLNIGFIRGGSSSYYISSSSPGISLEVNYSVPCTLSLNTGFISPSESVWDSGYVTSNGIKYGGTVQVAPTNGWARFPISTIPQNATIDSVKLRFYAYSSTIPSGSNMANYIRGFTGNPISLSGSSLYNLISQGILLNSTPWLIGTVNQPLENILMLDAVGFCQNQLSTGYLNIGFTKSGNLTYSIFGANSIDYPIALKVYYSVPLNPQITANGPTTFCANSNVELSAPSGSNLSYQWIKNGVNIPGANSLSYMATTEGNYKVQIITDEGCSTESNIISVNVLPMPNITLVSLDPEICDGESTLLTSNTNSICTYQWQINGNNIIGASNSNYSATLGGEYTVLVSDLNGCSSLSNVISVIVNSIPLANIINSDTQNLCIGNYTDLIANYTQGNSYQWEQNGVTISGANFPVYSVNTSGTYKVIVTNSQGCSNISNEVVVNFHFVPIGLIFSNDTLTVCEGSPVLLQINTNNLGIGFQWYINNEVINGEINSSYAATTSGIYECILNNNGCLSFSSNTFDLIMLPIPTLSIVGDTVLCLGESTTLTAYSNVANIIWNDSLFQQDLILSPSFSDNYLVEVIDTNGCENSQLINVEVHNNIDTVIFQSSYGPLEINGQIYAESGIYTQQLFSIYGCDSTVTLNLNVLFNDIETIEKLDLTIINPVKNGLVQIFSEDIEVIEVKGIYDILGRKINYEAIVENSDGITIQISVPIGAYYITLEKDGKLIQKKFIVVD